MKRVVIVFAIASAVALMGCPPQSNVHRDAGPVTCARIGDSCEFSPGKLGSCVHRDECTVEPCLVCQSQH